VLNLYIVAGREIKSSLIIPTVEPLERVGGVVERAERKPHLHRDLLGTDHSHGALGVCGSVDHRDLVGHFDARRESSSSACVSSDSGMGGIVARCKPSTM
jgi:hypothetical protein